MSHGKTTLPASRRSEWLKNICVSFEKQHFRFVEEPNVSQTLIFLSESKTTLSAFRRSEWTLQGSPALSSPWLSWGLLGSPRLTCALLGSAGLSWALLGSAGLSWAPLGTPGLSWALLGSPGLPWALLGSPGLLLGLSSALLRSRHTRLLRIQRRLHMIKALYPLLLWLLRIYIYIYIVVLCDYRDWLPSFFSNYAPP